MGMYDTVLIPCPNCDVEYHAQSKSGSCVMDEYPITSVPANVAENINRHAPFTCSACGQLFVVYLTSVLMMRQSMNGTERLDLSSYVLCPEKNK